MTGTASSSKRAVTAAFADPNDNTKRKRFAEWGAQVVASINGDSANPHGSSSACLFCGRHHSLAKCRGVLNLIAQHKARQLANHGGTSKTPFDRGSSWRTKKAAQFGALRAGGNGHHGRRGSPPGRSFRDDSRRPSKRVGFSSRPTPRFHTNNVSVPEQGDDAAVRQIVQANSASPTSSVLQSPLPRTRSLWSLLPLSAASSWLLSPIAISSSPSQALTTTSMRTRRSTLKPTSASLAPTPAALTTTLSMMMTTLNPPTMMTSRRRRRRRSLLMTRRRRRRSLLTTT